MPGGSVRRVSVQDAPIRCADSNESPFLSLSLDLTVRCNNDCNHCYLNLPANDATAKTAELSFEKIRRLADQATDMGAVWVLLTGGEPLLREDFPQIYLYLKRKGLLVSVYTNATLLTADHVALFRKYPPRDIEVTVYGADRQTYGRVTGRPANYLKFIDGLALMDQNGVAYRLKAMAITSTLPGFSRISEFCKARTKDFFYYDYYLHKRHDRLAWRNVMIDRERLSAEDIIRLEGADPDRTGEMIRERDSLLRPDIAADSVAKVFKCAIGRGSFHVTFDGMLRPCQPLCHPDFQVDLELFSLRDAMSRVLERVDGAISERPGFLNGCGNCIHVNLCQWCPAKAELEVRELDAKVDYFCEIAHARAVLLTSLCKK
jgi:MoaA/NifB/PqqE/SkfB family radical SAM enzyme